MNEQAVYWLIGVCITVALAVGGGFIKYLFGRMERHESNTIEAIDSLRSEVEARRIETRNNLLELMNAKLDAMWEILGDVKDKIS